MVPKHLSGRYPVPGHAGYIIDLWYDSHTRSYIAQIKAPDGHQIGDADYTGNRADAYASLRFLLEGAAAATVEGFKEQEAAWAEYKAAQKVIRTGYAFAILRKAARS